VQETDENWTELAWENLIYDINDKKCIPFIGPGASEKWIQLDRLAKEWAVKYHYPYPLEDSSQLPRVSQFLAIQEGDNTTKKMISRELKKPPPIFSENSVYAVLADLHLPIYITTNYDLLMENALRDKGKEPISGYSLWKELRETPSQDLPTSAKPLVFHLLGHIDNPTSMVLTIKDYIDFAIYLSKKGEKDTLPHSIRQNLPKSTLLFIGYRLEDLSFLIVFEGFIKLMSSFEMSESIAVQVQMPPNIESEKKNAIQKYLDKFTGSYFKIRIYWGDPDAFLEQLRHRWSKVRIQ
jgi:hypothetical protein